MDSLNPANYLSYIRPDLSYTPQTPDLGITDLLSLPDPGVTQPSSQPVDHIQQGLAEMSKLQPDYQAKMQPTYFDYAGSNASRYVGSTNYNALGFDPEIGRENEYKYGNMQTTSDMFGNAFAGAYKLAAATFIDGWKGWGRMTDALFSWDSSKLAGDPDELYQLNQEQKAIMDKYAIYQTKDSENSVFNRQLLGDMIQQSGFALGTTAQFLSEELLTMGMSSAFSLTKLGLTSGAKFARGAYKLSEMAADAKKVGDIWKSEGLVKKIYDGAKKFVPLVNTADDIAKAHRAGASTLQMASIGMGGIKRSLAEMNMAMTEARMEAAGTYGELYDRLYNEHLEKTGQAPVGKELERIERMSKAGAEDNFMINTGVLAVMNRIQFDNLFSKFAPERKLLNSLGQYGDDVLSVSGKVAGKETTRVYEKGVLGAVGQAGKIAEDFGKKKAAWEIAKDLGKGLSKWEVSEGAQELIQEGSNIALQDYYYDLYNGKKASMDKSIGKAVDDQMNTQGLKTFMMGALTGRLISPITGAFSKGVEAARTTSEQREGRAKDLKESIELINNFYKDPGKALNEAIANFNVQNKASEKMEDALSKRDEYYYNNVKDSAFAKMISAAKKTDMLESVLDTIREYGNHFTKEQMKEAFPGVDPSDNAISDAKAYFHKIAGEVEEFHKNWETLKDKYGDMIRPEFYKEGSEDRTIALRAKKALDDSLEILATNRFKAARSVERAKKLYSQVLENSNVGQSAAYAFRTMSNDKEMQKEIDMLTGELLVMTQGEDISKETREQIKKKNAELDALLEFQKHWKQDEESKDALLNLPALKKAYQSYINAKNNTSNLSANVTVTDIDDSWTMFMDYAFLNKDAIQYTDAFNTLANPSRFVQMFNANRDAIAESVEKLRNEAIEDAIKAHEQSVNPPAPEAPATDETPVNPQTPPTPPAPAGPAPAGETGGKPATNPKEWTVEEKGEGQFMVRSPKGALMGPYATREEAEEEADNYNQINGLKKPAKKETTEEPKGYYVEQTPDGSYIVRSPKKKYVAIFDTLEEAEAEAEEQNQLAASFNASKNPQPKAPAPQPTAQTELEKEIDGLSLAAVTGKTLQKAAAAVKEVFQKIASNNVLVDRLKTKIGEVKDQVMRNALMQIVTGKTETDGGYVPLKQNYNNAAVGQDKQSVKSLSGLNITGNKDLIRLLSQTAGEMADKIKVTATTKLVEANKAEAKALDIPNREHVTYETDSDVKKLQNGKSILTVGKKTRGYHFAISSKVGDGEIYLMGPDTYFIVNPDNSTVPVTFEEHQRQFVKENLLVDGKPMTDEQFDQLQENFMRFAYFQELVSSVLVDNAEGDITTLFNSYFNLTPGGVIAAQDEDMTSVFKNNPDKLFPVQVKDEEGNITNKNVPLLAFKEKGIWRLNFLTSDGETVVDDEGDAIDNVKEYVAQNFGVNPTLNYQAPYVWIAYAPNTSGKHFNKLIGRKRGTEPVEGYKAFLKEFDVLNKALVDGVKTGEYKYDGRIFNSTNQLMTYFNQDKFGFFTAGDWFVDLSYSPKSKNAAFTLELRPKDTRLRRALTAEQKSQLNVFFNIKKMQAMIDLVKDSKASNEDVIKGYNDWMQSLIQGYNKMLDGLKNSDDAVLKELYGKMDYHTLFFYEEANDQKNYMLKLTDKSEGTSIAPLLTFQGSANNVTGQLNIAFKKDSPSVDISEEPVVSNQEETPVSGPAPEQTGGYAFNPEAYTPDEDPFMLNDQDVKRYTENVYNDEVNWLLNNATLQQAGIKLSDLSFIINKLSAGKEILGYYRNRVIYVDNVMSGEGTIYHEAFHGLFRDVLNNQQREFYLGKAKQKLGKVSAEEISKFRNERNYHNLNDARILDLMAEELLADGFRDYKLKKQEPAEGWFKVFVKFLERLFNLLKSDSITNLYKDFDAGKIKTANSEVSNIADKGVFSLATGRPMLTLRPGASGNMEIRPIMDSRFLRPLNLEVQKEVVNKLTRLVSNKSEGSFEQRFAEAVEELKSEYDINKLIAQSPANEAGIRAKYGNFFTEASFILGASVPYDTDDSLAGNADVAKLMVPEGSNKQTLDIVKQDVNSKITSLGLDSGWIDGEFNIPEQDDEDDAEKEKGGEFDLIHMNPLSGISKEFRSLFSLIPYQETDTELGVKINRMADGNMLFNAVIKVASDRPTREILPALQTAVESLEEDNDRKAPQLRALANELGKQFGISDLSDPDAKPSKNLFLYKQFIDTFFVTELASSIVVVKLNELYGPSANVYDASINADVNNRKEAIGFHFNREFKKLKTEDQKLEFIKNFDDLKDYIKNELDNFLENDNINNRKKLNQQVDKLYDKLSSINIVLPKILLRRSLQAIYVKEKGKEFNGNSKESIREVEADQSLIKQGAYLTYDFFEKLQQIDAASIQHLFADTTDESINVSGNNLSNIDGINSILKKGTKLIIKYDINSAIPVFQNAENANIWRYSRYTPPILLAQMVREGGIQEITKLYPVLSDWFNDNPLFDGSIENELFLKNLNIEAFNGFREEIDGASLDGVTFGNIDSKALLISNLVQFMNRETISVRRKVDKKIEERKITTFKRSRTQEEATTTNFLVTAKYKKYVENGEVSDDFITDISAFFRQEYNRIQREWQRRNDSDVTRYRNYNEIGKTNQRAYQFRNMEHFFSNPSLSADEKAFREEMMNSMIQAAKDGKSFEQALTADLKGQPLGVSFVDELKTYVDQTLDVYLNKLRDLQIIKDVVTQAGDTIISSPFLSNKIREDYQNETLGNKGYNNIEDVVKDHHLNVFMNKLMVNQIFDGDVATGIKSATEYYKRNKSGVISGNSMKRGFFRTAVVENLQVFLNPNDLTQGTSDVQEEGLTGVDVADGQSYHTLNHRLRMMDSWGRATPRVRQLLNQYQYRPLTKDEINELAESKVVLNTIKTATGGVFEYYKLSEHLISRVDVSYLDPSKGTKEDVYETLDGLYMQIQSLEDLIVEDPSREDASELENRIAELYREVHSYWLPKKHRAKMHYMLNSMEKAGIDQLFDPNASKKTTLVPVKLETDTVTNLRPSKSYTSGLFKFLQVETSGVKNKITDPSQSRQLISTYLNKLATEKTYQDISLADLAKQYEKVMGDITKANNKKLNNAIFKDGKFDVASVFTMIRKGLAEQGADSNTLKFFELENGKPVHNVNLPIIKKHFTYYYFSLYNDSIYRVPISGRSDILVSAYGYEVLYNKNTGEIVRTEDYDADPQAYAGEEYATRHLGVSEEVKNGKTIYKVEVIIPKPLANNPEEAKLYLEKLNEFFSTRIPTEDKRSMVVCKVVDYIDAAYQNSIIVPQLVHILAGSDLDVDKLYSHTFDFYTDFNGKPHVYGDYSGFKTESQGKFVEYINYMLKDRTLSDLVNTQVDVVSNSPVIPDSFLRLKDELNISDIVLDKNTLVDRRKALELKRAQLAARYEKDKAAHDTAYEAAMTAGRGDRESQDAFNKARAQYLFLMDQQRATQEELNEVRAELKKINNTIRLIALHNVLISKGFPTTQVGLTKYTAENGNPVVSTLQNERLQMKMDILSNETVFNDQYIKEKSDTKQFSDIAKSIGATVEDVINENSIHSVMGDVVANELNSSNKDGIGITASFNKFLAFAQKNNISLPFGVYMLDETTGQSKTYADFQDSESIRNIGAQLGMFADAAKEPIPSVINLNPETSFVSSMLVGIGVDMQVALLINKLPIIEQATINTVNGKSSAKDPSIYGTTIESELYAEMSKIFEKLDEEKRLDELFIKTPDGLELRQFFIKKVTPNPNAVNFINPTVADLGIQVYNKDGNIVKEDIATYFLANLYVNISDLKKTVLPTGEILNLIKQQKPDFYALDRLIHNFRTFKTSKDFFKKQIGEILNRSQEYKPLIQAAMEQAGNASDILLERNSLFRRMSMSLASAASFSNKNTNTFNSFNDQLVKFIIVNRTKADMVQELKELQAKPNPNPTAVKILEEGLNLFKADFWINNEDEMAARLEYLAENHPSNPFVEFLRFTKRDGIHFFEASSRMKLDKDIAEGIIMGYEALQKSLDPETKAISRFMFYYLMVKDNLGYGSNSFISYISPDLKQYRDVSNMLTDFHNVLKGIQPQINSLQASIEGIMTLEVSDERKKELIDKKVDELLVIVNGAFDNLFKNDTGKAVDWINVILRKILTNSANEKYYAESSTTILKTDEEKKELQQILDNGLLGDRKIVVGNKGKLDLLKQDLSEYTFDYSKQKYSKTLEEVSKDFNIAIAESEDEKSLIVYFPSVIKTRQGKLLKLKSMDGNSMSKKTLLDVVTSLPGEMPIGKVAVYEAISFEGSEKLSNLGFTNTEGKKIYDFVQEQRNAKQSEKLERRNTAPRGFRAINQSANSEDEKVEILVIKNGETLQDAKNRAAGITTATGFAALPGKSATPTMTYAGIGSRQTPQEVLDLMTEAAKYLEGQGFTLNTGTTFKGKEEGADAAFSRGTTKKNLFAPEGAGPREIAIAEEIHPKPDALSSGAMKLMARNTNQVFGENLDTPVDFVLFYAEETDTIRPKGGTGQAVEMARRKGIPTINMMDEDWRDQLKKVLKGLKNNNVPTTATPVANTSAVLGDIKLNIIEEWVKTGQATTTVRSDGYHKSFYKGDGVYGTDKGNLVQITYKGLVKLQGNNIVGNGFSYTKDEFAAAEGFGNWANFQKGAKYAGQTLMEGGKVHLYQISPVAGKAAVNIPQQSLLTKGEIMDIYRVKEERDETLMSFTNRVNDFIAALGKTTLSKDEIIDQLKSCL